MSCTLITDSSASLMPTLNILAKKLLLVLLQNEADEKPWSARDKWLNSTEEQEKEISQIKKDNQLQMAKDTENSAQLYMSCNNVLQ